MKSEILIMTGMVWPVSSDKWKAPEEIKNLLLAANSKSPYKIKLIIILSFSYSIIPLSPVISASALVNSRVICPSSSFVENHRWHGNSTVSPDLRSSTIT